MIVLAHKKRSCSRSVFYEALHLNFAGVDGHISLLWRYFINSDLQEFVTDRFARDDRTLCSPVNS